MALSYYLQIVWGTDKVWPELSVGRRLRRDSGGCCRRERRQKAGITPHRTSRLLFCSAPSVDLCPLPPRTSPCSRLPRRFIASVPFRHLPPLLTTPSSKHRPPKSKGTGWVRRTLFTPRCPS